MLYCNEYFYKEKCWNSSHILCEAHSSNHTKQIFRSFIQIKFQNTKNITTWHAVKFLSFFDEEFTPSMYLETVWYASRKIDHRLRIQPSIFLLLSSGDVGSTSR